MEVSMANLLLMFILCIASWPAVKAENSVRIEEMSTSITNGDVLEDWSSEVSNNIIATNVNVKKGCPGSVQAEINVYKDGTLVNTVSQTYKQPFKEFQSSNICASFDGPEPDDDTCSAASGEHMLQDCDVSSWFSDMDPGNYEAICNFQVDNESVAEVTLKVTVESE